MQMTYAQVTLPTAGLGTQRRAVPRCRKSPSIKRRTRLVSSLRSHPRCSLLSHLSPDLGTTATAPGDSRRRRHTVSPAQAQLVATSSSRSS
ncbi:hypothetical protein C8Q80DRAFT_234528 [Daedaleopsis nitida]|nr:hypothetical protein C8Q80DRAFT_234528 [Daedaleopsis nitida]